MQEKHDAFHMPGYWKTLLSQISACWMMLPAYTKADFPELHGTRKPIRVEAQQQNGSVTKEFKNKVAIIAGAGRFRHH
jgi:hypothetical protein